MSLFIATRGASDPWTTVPVIPDRHLTAEAVRQLRAIRAILRSNAASLGEPCHIRAVVVDCRETNGPAVALVIAATGRIAKSWPAPSLWESLTAAVAAAEAAAARAAAR